jgi:hypothetical protein
MGPAEERKKVSSFRIEIGTALLEFASQTWVKSNVVQLVFNTMNSQTGKS